MQSLLSLPTSRRRRTVLLDALQVERDLADRTDGFDQVTVCCHTRFQTDHLAATVIDGDRICIVH